MVLGYSEITMSLAIYCSQLEPDVRGRVSYARAHYTLIEVLDMISESSLYVMF